MTRLRSALTQICFIVPALLLGVASGCKTQQSKYEPPAPPAVAALTTEFNQLPALVRKGTVAAGAQFRLGFQVPGVLEMLCCRTGDKVRQGQLLATLRAGDADARLRAANASRAMAERDEATTSHLVGGGALAPNLAKHARDQLAIAEAQTTLAGEALRYTRLQSPVAGTVQMRFAEPGESIAPGTPVLLVEQMGKLVVRVGVLQDELAGIVPGTVVRLEIDDGVNLGSQLQPPDAGIAPPLVGVVSSVAPVPEATDGLFTVEVNPQMQPSVKLVPGAIVSVYFKSPIATRTVKIPNDALVVRKDTTGVLVLQERDGLTSAHFRAVKIAKRLGKDIWTNDGLTSGEQIVAEGAYFIDDGERVRVLPKAAVPHG